MEYDLVDLNAFEIGEAKGLRNISQATDHVAKTLITTIKLRAAQLKEFDQIAEEETRESTGWGMF